MKGQDFIILFKGDKAYLTQDTPLSFNQVELGNFKQPFKSTAFWVIRVLNYIENEKKLFCEVLSYNVGEIDFPINQKKFSPELNQVVFVNFRSLDTASVFKTMSLKDPQRCLPTKEPPVFRNENRIEATQITNSEPQKLLISKKFEIPLKEICFIKGGASFHKTFEGFNRSFELIIYNSYIKEEFNVIKNYFANALNTKKIQVSVNLELQGDDIIFSSTNSPEIGKIDPQLIDEVKLDLLKSMKKKSHDNPGCNLFTMDEYFNAFGEEDLKANTFYRDDNEFFLDLLKTSETKHKRHLEFLSEKHSYHIMKLRFIQSPFSFLFLIEGNKNYYFIWETLDTEEATYVWYLEKYLSTNLYQEIKKIDDNINIIKEKGKTDYLKSSKGLCYRIRHDYLDNETGFITWKAELESKLI